METLRENQLQGTNKVRRGGGVGGVGEEEGEEIHVEEKGEEEQSFG